MPPPFVLPALSRPQRALPAAVAGIAVALLLVGCDPTVEPIRETDQIFSVYAALDPAADTQFVRVEALRDDTPIGAPDSIDATVTLRDVRTDQTLTLRDSLTEVGPGIPTHVFWTDASLRPGATYRLRVERSDGARSAATVTLPERRPALDVDEAPVLPCQDARNRGRDGFIVDAAGADRLAGAYALYPLLDRFFRRSTFRSIEQEQDTFRVTVGHAEDLEAIGANILPNDLGCPPRRAFSTDSIFVAVATAGPDWPNGIDSLSLDALARPDVAQNVEQGAGFVGGIYTDTLGVPIVWDD